MTSAAKPRLLIVDDQPINIQTLFHIFDADHEVFMATSGAQALAFCDAQLPDLILLDVMMPEMDGHAVCRHLKAAARTRDIPVIFVTAQSDPAEETLGLHMGAVDFISKPVNASVVRARVGAQLLLRQSLYKVQELNATLEDRVTLRTAELESALQRLQQSQESLASSEAKATLSTLVASVSHELSTPLGNSLMAASTLSDHVNNFQTLVDGGSLKRSDLTHFLEMLQAGASMVALNLQRANQLLSDFRQVAADQASEQRRVFDLAHTVQEIVHSLSPGLKRHTHRIVQNIPAGITLDSQPGPLGQVVINLINNAYLHAFEKRNDGVLTISATEAQDTITLRFADNGVGIPAEHLEKLFQPFFSTKIGKGGTGLGMAIVHNLVTKTLGGTVTVKSAPGQGAEIQVQLPKTLLSKGGPDSLGG